MGPLRLLRVVLAGLRDHALLLVELLQRFLDVGNFWAISAIRGVLLVLLHQEILVDG